MSTLKYWNGSAWTPLVLSGIPDPLVVNELDALSRILVGSRTVPGWGQGILGFDSGWAGQNYFTIGSQAAQGADITGIMLGNPHIPWRTSTGVNAGAKVRFATAPAATNYWDIGCINGDELDFFRNGAQLAYMSSSGGMKVNGSLNAGGGTFFLRDIRAMYSPSGDTYLRINEDAAFSSGVYFGSSKVIASGTGIELWNSAPIQLRGGAITIGDTAPNIYGGFKAQWTGEGSVAIYADRPATNTAVSCKNVAIIMDAGLAAYKSIWALAFTVQSSSKSVKEDFEDLPYSALKSVQSAPVVKFHFKPEFGQDLPNNWHVGPMADDLPEEILVPEGREGINGVDLYSMVGLLWKAVQELAERTENDLQESG